MDKKNRQNPPCFESVKNNSHFCPIPFFLLYTRSLGRPRLCPMALKKPRLAIEGEHVSVNEDNVGRHWNSAEMRAIRKSMIDDLPPEDCRVCREQEAAGLKTLKAEYRTYYTETVRDRVEEAIRADGHVSAPPSHWDLSIGNVCNLACRICTPTNSSRLETEIEHNYADVSEKTQRLLDGYRRNKSLHVSEKTYFRDILLNRLETLQELKIQGGEPTVSPVVWETLEEIHRRGYSQSVNLMIFTNMQSFKNRYLHILNNFRGLLFCSIDGYGPENDFLRHPSRFSDIEENLKTLNHLNSGWRISLKTSISFYNCLTYLKLVDWAEKFFPRFLPRGELNIHDVATPEYLQPFILEKARREKILPEVDRRQKDYWLFSVSPAAKFNLEALEAYRRILSAPDVRQADILTGQALDSIRDFDKMRRQSTFEVFPHLIEFFARHR